MASSFTMLEACKRNYSSILKLYLIVTRNIDILESIFGVIGNSYIKVVPFNNFGIGIG